MSRCFAGSSQKHLFKIMSMEISGVKQDSGQTTIQSTVANYVTKHHSLSIGQCSSRESKKVLKKVIHAALNFRNVALILAVTHQKFMAYHLNTRCF